MATTILGGAFCDYIDADNRPCGARPRHVEGDLRLCSWHRGTLREDIPGLQWHEPDEPTMGMVMAIERQRPQPRPQGNRRRG